MHQTIHRRTLSSVNYRIYGFLKLYFLINSPNYGLQDHYHYKTITDYKPPPQTCDSTIPLLNELNAFFARFEAQNSTTAQKTPPPPGDQVMTLSPNSVRRSLGRINARKAPGPDNIPGRVLRDCAVELTDVFTDIFNISLSQAVVPHASKLPPSFQSQRSHLHPASMTTVQ